ncbi:ATP-binding protein [Vibrio lentus]|nr:ATP-binding protein [Vibrio lentus]
MDGQGTLTISSEDWVENGVSHGAIVHVQDEGCGIKEEQLKRVFFAFLYHQTRWHRFRFVSISKYFESNGRGEIRVESEVGKESRFSIYLQRKATPQLLVSNL